MRSKKGTCNKISLPHGEFADVGQKKPIGALGNVSGTLEKFLRISPLILFAEIIT